MKEEEEEKEREEEAGVRSADVLTTLLL